MIYLILSFTSITHVWSEQAEISNYELKCATSSPKTDHRITKLHRVLNCLIWVLPICSVC